MAEQITQLPDGSAILQCSYTSADICRVALPFIDAMNDQLRSGESIDLVLGGLMYTCGSALAQRGVRLDPATIPGSLAVLALGYTSTKEEERQSEDQQLTEPS